MDGAIEDSSSCSGSGGGCGLRKGLLFLTGISWTSRSLLLEKKAKALLPTGLELAVSLTLRALPEDWDVEADPRRARPSSLSFRALREPTVSA
jgi:hypothetical protein